MRTAIIASLRGTTASIVAQLPQPWMMAEIDGEELLPKCLEHPRYIKLAEALGDAVAARSTFDHY